MRRKLKSNYGIESLKFKVKSFSHTFNFQLLTFDLVVLLFILVVNACSTKEVSNSDTYTCPMHPTVISDKPGVCPVCAMDLVRKARPGEEVKITEDLARLLNSTNEVIVSDISTIKGEYKSMPVSLSLNGIVTYDTRAVYTISSRIGGRLEKVYVKYFFQPVTKGQKIAEVYSPELVNAQREYIYLLEHDASNHALIDAAKDKLILMGVTEAQLNVLKTSKEIIYSFSVYSPHAGYVITENQTAPVASGNSLTSSSMSTNGMGMSGSASNSSGTQSTSPVSISPEGLTRTGSYVNAGKTLFRIVNTDNLWIEFNVPVSMGSYIKKGESLICTINNNELKLQVDLIEPFIEAGEDFIKVRSYVKKSALAIGRLVKANLTTHTNELLWLPKSAVLDLGNGQLVFIKVRGVFKPRKIKTGTSTNDWIEIQSGLASGDEVAVKAQYLIDSENFIKSSN
jgi:membrane fusion protein, copper/silver efflux system